jgi:hypothetical protein
MHLSKCFHTRRFLTFKHCWQVTPGRVRLEMDITCKRFAQWLHVLTLTNDETNGFSYRYPDNHQRTGKQQYPGVVQTILIPSTTVQDNAFIADESVAGHFTQGPWLFEATFQTMTGIGDAIG